VAPPVEAPKSTTSSILERLPRLSTSVWMILILALFLIVMVPMVTGYLAQTAEQAAVQLQTNLVQSQIDALRAKIASQSTATTGPASMKKELDAAKAQYKNVGDNAEVSQVIMNLAWDYDVTITSMGVSESNSKVSGTEYPVLNYSLSLTGQVANFQNFLIAAGKKLPSSQFTEVTISPATVEGELDTASISIQVYCNK
jgi:type II secretory pathway pseudopilin PulG